MKYYKLDTEIHSIKNIIILKFTTIPGILPFLYYFIMIVGIGTDIVQVSRINLLLARYGKARFMKRIFTREEIEASLNCLSASFEDHLAGRFAAKEAVFKSLSSIKRLGWRDFSILPSVSGLKVILPKTQLENINVHVSISHDGGYALAHAIAFSE